MEAERLGEIIKELSENTNVVSNITEVLEGLKIRSIPSLRTLEIYYNMIVDPDKLVEHFKYRERTVVIRKTPGESPVYEVIIDKILPLKHQDLIDAVIHAVEKIDLEVLNNTNSPGVCWHSGYDPLYKVSDLMLKYIKATSESEDEEKLRIDSMKLLSNTYESEGNTVSDYFVDFSVFFIRDPRLGDSIPIVRYDNDKIVGFGIDVSDGDSAKEIVEFIYQYCLRNKIELIRNDVWESLDK